MYITQDKYAALYGSLDNFTRFQYEACRFMDKFTTGIDGVKKLKVAYPTDNDAVCAVEHCCARIIYILSQVQQAEKASAQTRGIDNKVIASVSAGNESISYTTQQTAIEAASFSPSALSKLVGETIREYLTGVTDANGVNLLYMGVYPRV